MVNQEKFNCCHYTGGEYCGKHFADDNYNDGDPSKRGKEFKVMIFVLASEGRLLKSVRVFPNMNLFIELMK